MPWDIRLTITLTVSSLARACVWRVDMRDCGNLDFMSGNLMSESFGRMEFRRANILSLTRMVVSFAAAFIATENPMRERLEF